MGFIATRATVITSVKRWDHSSYCTNSYYYSQHAMSLSFRHSIIAFHHPQRHPNRLVVVIPSASSSTTLRTTITTTTTKRYYMDVHTRPSHSGMFTKTKTKHHPSTKPTTTLDGSATESASVGALTATTTTSTVIPPPPSFLLSEEQFISPWELYRLLLYRLLCTMGMIHCFVEYFGDVTLCEGPSMVSRKTFQRSVFVHSSLFFHTFPPLPKKSNSCSCLYFFSWIFSWIFCFPWFIPLHC
jgi:hypothetical protein